ncbi:ABC transporter permease [Natrialbaceae archaeon A-arb3/5]
MTGDGDGNRRTRWAGLAGLSITRLWKRATRTRSGRIAATVSAVALTIALLVMVTGVAFALADGGVTSETDAEVTIAPESSGTLSSIDGVEEPRLGETNERADTIGSQDGVEHASPMLVEMGELETADDGDSQPVILVGVEPDETDRTVAGLSTAGLESDSGDDATDGAAEIPSREIVLSQAAAEQLGADEGDEVGVPASDADEEAAEVSLTVTTVEETAGEREADVPVALVHLDSLQQFTGAASDEIADEVLVWGESDAAQLAAVDAYPDASVDVAESADPAALFDDGLAFAASFLSLIVGVTICASFVATTAGMSVNEDRRTLAVLESVGVPTAGRLTVVGISTLVTTLAGALLGVGLGVGGIHVVNAIADATLGSGAVALVHPLFVPYALVVALVSGLIAVPYPLAVAARTSVLEEVGR